MSRIAIYPGTFDPLTNGHIDVIKRAARLADKLLVSVAHNAGKSPLFSLDQRKEMVQSAVDKLKADEDGFDHIEVNSFSGLLTDFARQTKATVLVRGLRAVADFEYEFQMATANKRLYPSLETIFLTAAEQQHFVASSLVKEIARYGGDVSSFVPEEIAQRLAAAFSAHS